MASLDGKVALVTGAAQGIGRGVAEELLQNHVKVSIVDINEDAVRQTVKELKSTFGENEVIEFVCDVTNESQFETCIKKTKSHFNRLDVLINNAGIVNRDDYKKTIDVNLASVISGTNLALRHLANDKGECTGMVINTASIAGFVVFPTNPSYSATKSGVISFTRCVGHQDNWKKTGIKVNAVCPDITKTPLALQSLDKDESMREMINKIYDGKMLSTKEVAKAYIKLLEDDLSGEVIVVSVRKGLYYLLNEKMTEF